MKKCLVVIFAILCLFQKIAWAGPGFYDGTASLPENKAWMAWVSDYTPIRAISIPGTHDSGSRYGVYWSKNQSLTITQQLEAGVRYLDVRLRHIGDSFAIHHGSYYQNAMFGNVLGEVVAFLSANPSEFVFVRVKEEYTPANNTRSFEQTFDNYRARYANYIWSPTKNADPGLSEVRGRIVFLQDFNSSMFPPVGLSYGSFDIQDTWDIGYDSGKENTRKVDLVKRKLWESVLARTNVINQLAISSPPQTPLGSAQVINESVLNYMVSLHSDRPYFFRYVGIVPMDYPGAGIIDHIVGGNYLRCERAFFDVKTRRIVGCLGRDLSMALNSISGVNIGCDGDRSTNEDKVTCYVRNTNTVAPTTVKLAAQCTMFKAVQGRYLDCGQDVLEGGLTPLVSCVGTLNVKTGVCTNIGDSTPKTLGVSCGNIPISVPDSSIANIYCGGPSAAPEVGSPTSETLPGGPVKADPPGFGATASAVGSGYGSSAKMRLVGGVPVRE